jgi:CRP-like cAMP-binding protein
MDKTVLLNFIQTILPMPLEKAEQISNYFYPKLILKNDYLLREGNICIESHFIQEGLCRSYVIDINGNDITTHFYRSIIFANDFLSFFKRLPAKVNIQALSDCKTWAISYSDLQLCFHSIPEFREFGRMMLINNYSQLQNRMLEMLQLTAEQRYENLIKTHTEIFKYAPLKNIATYLGIKDTSLSRIRKEITKK